eukprot:5202958-Pleurochrysis_carterae.AAC.1
MMDGALLRDAENALSPAQIEWVQDTGLAVVSGLERALCAAYAMLADELDDLIALLVRCLHQRQHGGLAHVAAESLLHLVRETGANFSARQHSARRQRAAAPQCERVCPHTSVHAFSRACASRRSCSLACIPSRPLPAPVFEPTLPAPQFPLLELLIERSALLPCTVLRYATSAHRFLPSPAQAKRHGLRSATSSSLASRPRATLKRPFTRPEVNAPLTKLKTLPRTCIHHTHPRTFASLQFCWLQARFSFFFRCDSFPSPKSTFCGKMPGLPLIELDTVGSQ